LNIFEYQFVHFLSTLGGDKFLRKKKQAGKPVYDLDY